MSLSLNPVLVRLKTFMCPSRCLKNGSETVCCGSLHSATSRQWEQQVVGAGGGSKRPNGSCFGGTKKAVGKRAGCATRILPAMLWLFLFCWSFFSFVLFFCRINHPLCEVYNYVQHATYSKLINTRGCYGHWLVTLFCRSLYYAGSTLVAHLYKISSCVSPHVID